MGVQNFDESHATNIISYVDQTYVPGTNVTLTCARALPFRIDSFMCINTDVGAKTLTLAFYDEGATIKTVGTYTIPLGAGTGIIPLFDLLALLTPTDSKYLYGQGTSFCRWSIAEAIGAGKLAGIWAKFGYLA